MSVCKFLVSWSPFLSTKLQYCSLITLVISLVFISFQISQSLRARGAIGALSLVSLGDIQHCQFGDKMDQLRACLICEGS